MNLTDINTIKPLLARHGFKFSKGLGQNFLCDAAVPAAIAEGAGISPEACVLEVGPGIGALTRELAARARLVVAIELDRRLPAVLAQTMAGYENFRLEHGDVLKTDLKALCEKHFGESPARAVANLPYYITTPAVSALIECGAFESITVMVQREVAQRFCAAPGGKDYGAFSVYIAYHAEPKIILDVGRECFIPSPNVDSAVVRMDMRKAPPVDVPPDRLFRVVKAAFAQRRKTLLNCLCAALPGKADRAEMEKILISLDISPSRRGETLSLEEFARIAKNIPE